MTNAEQFATDFMHREFVQRFFSNEYNQDRLVNLYYDERRGCAVVNGGGYVLPFALLCQRETKNQSREYLERVKQNCFTSLVAVYNRAHK